MTVNKLITITILVIQGEWAYNTVFVTYVEHIYITMKAKIKSGANYGRFYLAIYANPYDIFSLRKKRKNSLLGYF